MNILTRFRSNPTARYWDKIKHICRYIRGTVDLGLFFPNSSISLLVAYADVEYMLDPYFGRSQTIINLHIMVLLSHGSLQNKLWQ